MKLYWGLNSIPELAGLPKAQQRQLWWASLRLAVRRPRIWGPAALVSLVFQAVYSGIRSGPGSQRGRALALALVGALESFVSDQVMIRAMRPLLADRRAASAALIDQEALQ